MEFHVAQLMREPVGSRREYDVDETCGNDQNTAPFHVRGHVNLLRTDAGLLATADLESAVLMACSRCLGPAQVPVQLHIDEEFYPSVDVVTGVRLPHPNDPMALLIDEHHILNLCEPARQQLVVAEPMQPLCREDCAGLCPGCGRDRNEGPCGCPPDEIDDRWAALGGLLRGRDN
jgi:uncharacterized protein